MNRKCAVSAVWDLINKNKYSEARILMIRQRRIHGNRLFSYWMRLAIENGIWEESLERSEL